MMKTVELDESEESELGLTYLFEAFGHGMVRVEALPGERDLPWLPLLTVERREWLM